MKNKKLKKLVRDRVAYTGETYSVALAKLRSRDHFRVWLSEVAALEETYGKAYRNAREAAHDAEVTDSGAKGFLARIYSPESQRAAKRATEGLRLGAVRKVLEGHDGFVISLAALAWLGRGPEDADDARIEGVGRNLRNAAHLLLTDGRDDLASYLVSKPLHEYLPKGLRLVARAGVDLHTLPDTETWGATEDDIRRRPRLGNLERKIMRLLAENRAWDVACLGAAPHEPTLHRLMMRGYVQRSRNSYVHTGGSGWDLTGAGAQALE